MFSHNLAFCQLFKWWLFPWVRFLYIATLQIGVNVKCTFSLLTSRLQCLRRLYSLKPWACVSVLLSDYWPSIRRRIKPLCLLCFFCLLTFWPVSAVRAQEPTPTNTLVPFYTAPTPGPAINYDCPEGIPEGWGEYEPHPAWLFHCSHCLPSGNGYEWPEPPEGWDEPPEGWPTPTPGPTVTPTADPINNDISIHYLPDNFTVPNNTSYVTGNLGQTNPQGMYTQTSHNHGSNDYQFTIEMEFSGTLNSGNSFCQDRDIFIRFTSIYADVFHYKIVDGDGAGYENTVYPSGITHTDIPIHENNCRNTETVNLHTLIQVTITGSHNSMNDGLVSFYRGNWTYNGDLTGTYAFRWYPGLVNEFPDIGGETSSYCDTVLPLGSGDEDDPNFSLPGFWFGDMQCFTIGGFDVPLQWLNIFFEDAQIEDWTMPGMQFCFQSIHFDNLTLFGLEINLDWIALAMGGVVLFRFLTRS